MDFIQRTCRKAQTVGARVVYRLRLHAEMSGNLTCR